VENLSFNFINLIQNEQTFAPDCPFPQCPSICIKDPAKVELSRGWKSEVKVICDLKWLNDTLGHSLGQFRSACGQQYFFSTVNKSFTGAYAECCKYGMSLLSIESVEEIQCIEEMNNGTSFLN